jgi:Homeodomain-like domain-containing protein
VATIACGWCGEPTPEVDRCTGCGRDPRLPYLQRVTEPPIRERDEDGGRPALDAASVRQRYREAKLAIEGRGGAPTVEAIAEELDRSPRTVRDWRRRFGLE